MSQQACGRGSVNSRQSASTTQASAVSMEAYLQCIVQVFPAVAGADAHTAARHEQGCGREAYNHHGNVALQMNKKQHKHNTCLPVSTAKVVLLALTDHAMAETSGTRCRAPCHPDARNVESALSSSTRDCLTSCWAATYQWLLL